MAQVIWTESALDDLESIVRHIAKDSPVYAERVGLRIVAAPRRLRDMPLIGRKVPEFDDHSIRELIYGSYRILYQVSGSSCFVLAVIHGSRDIFRHFESKDWLVE